jgi:hypothetical protein
MKPKKPSRQPARRGVRSLPHLVTALAIQTADGSRAARRTPVRRRRGRPPVGKGVQVICVSIERGLLHETDRLARKLGVPRTTLIARGLRALLDQEVPLGL